MKSSTKGWLFVLIGLMSMVLAIWTYPSQGQTFLPRLVQYEIIIYTDHHTTNGLSFRQHVRTNSEPASPSSYRLVYAEVMSKIPRPDSPILVPVGNSVIFVARESIKAIKITATSDVRPASMQSQDFLREIPDGPAIRLDKLQDFSILE